MLSVQICAKPAKILELVNSINRSGKYHLRLSIINYILCLPY
jgi:hypothetical protein